MLRNLISMNGGSWARSLLAVFLLCALGGCVNDLSSDGGSVVAATKPDCSISDVMVVDYDHFNFKGYAMVAIVDPCAIEQLKPYNVFTTQQVTSRFQDGLEPNDAPFAHAKSILKGLQTIKSGEAMGSPVGLRRHLSCTGRAWEQGTFGVVAVDLDEMRVLRAVLFRRVESEELKYNRTKEELVQMIIEDQERLPSGYKECVLSEWYKG